MDFRYPFLSRDLAWRALLAISVVLLLSACNSGSGGTSSGGGYASLTFGVTWPPGTPLGGSGVGPLSLHVSPQSVPASVLTMQVVISGGTPAMTAMTTNFDVASHPSSGIVNDVPAGTGRTIQVNGLSSVNTVIYQAAPVVADLVANTPSDLGTLTLGEKFGFLYVANNSDQTLAALTEGQASGKLRGNGLGITDKNPSLAVATPNGKFIYTVNQGSSLKGSISGFSVDSVTGRLTAIAGSPFLCGASACPTGLTFYEGLAVHPSGNYLYATETIATQVVRFAIDSSTGALTVKQHLAAGQSPGILCVDPTGKYAYVADSNASAVLSFTIDRSGGTTDGNLTAVGTPPTLSSASAVVATAANAYAIDSSDFNKVHIYTIQSDGSLVAAATPTVDSGAQVTALALDPTGKFLYVLDSAAAQVWAYSLNASGIPVPQGTQSTGTAPNSIAVDAAGQYAYVTNSTSNTVSVFQVNSSTGALTAAATPTLGAGDKPEGIVAISPSTSGRYTPQFAFLTDSVNGTSAYGISSTTGALTAVGTPIAGTPAAVIVDPFARFAFTANGAGNDISRMNIATNGGLSSLGANTASDVTLTLANVLGIAVDASGQYLYALNGGSTDSVTMYSYDSVGATGDVTNGNCGGTCPAATGATSLFMDPLGRFAYSVNTSPTSGDNTVIPYTWIAGDGSLNATSQAAGQFPSGGNALSAAVDPTGRFLYLGRVAAGIYGFSINQSSVSNPKGTLAQLNSGNPYTSTAAPTNCASIAIHPTGSYLYAACGRSIDIFNLTLTSGALTSQSTVTAGNATTSLVGLAIDPSGEFLYAVDQNTTATGQSVLVYAINTDGSLTARTPLVISGSANLTSIAVWGTLK